MGNTLYEQDFHAWAIEQAELLRTGRVENTDLETIAEEIESMGKSQRSEPTNRLIVLLMHLLKWRSQPGHHGNCWRLAIKEQRRALERHLRDNPSLTSYLDQAMTDAYGEARLQAERETGLAGETFPETCIFTFDQAVDDAFWPGD